MRREVLRRVVAVGPDRRELLRRTARNARRGRGYLDGHQVASVTVNVVLPVTVSLVADTVVLPTPTVVASPFEPAALLTVATALSEDAQVTCAVRSCVELSL